MALQGERGAGGTHALQFRMFVRIAPDPIMSFQKPFHESSTWIGRRLMPVDLEHSFNREPAGFLSPFITTHAVGNHGESAYALEIALRLRLPIGQGILIVLAPAAHIGLVRDFDTGPREYVS